MFTPRKSTAPFWLMRALAILSWTEHTMGMLGPNVDAVNPRVARWLGIGPKWRWVTGFGC